MNLSNPKSRESAILALMKTHRLWTRGEAERCFERALAKVESGASPERALEASVLETLRGRKQDEDELTARGEPTLRVSLFDLTMAKQKQGRNERKASGP